MCNMMQNLPYKITTESVEKIRFRQRYTLKIKNTKFLHIKMSSSNLKKNPNFFTVYHRVYFISRKKSLDKIKYRQLIFHSDFKNKIKAIHEALLQTFKKSSNNNDFILNKKDYRQFI